MSGAQTPHDARELPLRFVALGGSLVSDLGNPVATSARAILAAIAAAGHDVTFLEQRNGPALVSLLRARGVAPYRAFVERYPAIQYRTYDPVQGWARTVWFNREIGTASAVIALPGTPAALIPEIAQNTSNRLVRLVDESFGAFTDVVPLGRVGELGVVFGPAVLPANPRSERRSTRLLIVAYDDAEAARRLVERFGGEETELVATGTADLPGWRYVPEVVLPDEYARHTHVAITGAGDGAWSLARWLLPIASGATLIETPPAMMPIPDRLRPAFDASLQAANLIAIVRAALPS